MTENGTMFSSSLEKVSWMQCREKVQQVNANLCRIIDALSPDESLPLWLVKYPFGAVIDDGQFYYPTPCGGLATLSDKKLPKELRESFAYAGLETPAGVVLANSIETFIEDGDRVIPRALFMPGDIFALWGRLDPQPTFHPSPLMRGTAGARSLFMVPNISDVTLHKKLRNEFNIRKLPPKNLTDQWSIFRLLVNQAERGKDWHVEAIFFPEIWIKKIKTDPHFLPLYVYLLEQAWRSSAYWRNKVFYDFIFSCVQERRNLRPDPYLLDTLKYIVAIAIGAVPGFGVATTNLAAPIELLQQIYVECYGLKKYSPTIMHPVHFNLDIQSQPVYYSLLHPTTLEFSPRSRKFFNTLYDLSEIKYILDVFLSEVMKKQLKVENGIIGKVIEQVGFDFFHYKANRLEEVNLSKDMLAGDSYLTRCLYDQSAHHFADSGTFVRGCIRVSNK